MFEVKDFLKLIRFEQWYKNIVVFLPLVFSFNLFNKKLFFLTLLGFISLCFISSSYYIINDIVDRKKDKNHPEKKERPLAAGKIKKSHAIFISAMFFILSLLLASSLSYYFLLAVILLFFLSQIYTFYIRNVIFMDLILISVNFVIRALSGAFIINCPISYWFILLIFFISLFLISMKRASEISLDELKNYRPNFASSNKNVLIFIANLSAISISIFFSIYAILFERPFLLFSLPFSLYLTFSFYNCFYTSPKKVRNPEKFIFQKKILLNLFLWLIIIITSLYIIK